MPPEMTMQCLSRINSRATCSFTRAFIDGHLCQQRHMGIDFQLPYAILRRLYFLPNAYFAFMKFIPLLEIAISILISHKVSFHNDLKLLPSFLEALARQRFHVTDKRCSTPRRQSATIRLFRYMISWSASHKLTWLLSTDKLPGRCHLPASAQPLLQRWIGHIGPLYLSFGRRQSGG